jgi:hypothetical protein
LGTTTLPLIVPVRVLVQIVLAAWAAETPANAAGTAKPSAKAKLLIAIPPLYRLGRVRQAVGATICEPPVD